MSPEPAPERTMRAAVYRRYGPPEVVQIEAVPRPTPGPREVRIRTRATTVSAGDWRVRSLEVPRGFGLLVRPALGLTGPRKQVLGTELAGVVDAVGEQVTRFRVGDAVFAYPGFGLGAHAEQRVMPEDGNVLPLPAGLGFEESAALCFGGLTALYFLRDRARVQPGERLLVVGASGTVGSAAVQLGRHFGAHVVGVSTHTDVVRGLGAHEVVDYRQQDPLAGGPYDVIFDAVGAVPTKAGRAALTPRGRLLLAAGSLGQLLGGALTSLWQAKKVMGGTTPERRPDMETLRTLAEAGHYRPLIDCVLPFERVVEAHARVASGRKCGSVVLSFP